MRRLVMMAVLVMAGCSNPFCSEDRRVVEVTRDPILRGLEQHQLDTYRRQGYDCRSDGSVRDGFGRSVGTRYVCTKC